MDDTFIKLSEEAENFLTTVRTGIGYRDDLFQTLCAAVRDLDMHFAASDSLPKKYVSVLVKIIPEIEKYMHLYDDTTKEQLLFAESQLFDVYSELAYREHM